MAPDELVLFLDRSRKALQRSRATVWKAQQVIQHAQDRLLKIDRVLRLHPHVSPPISSASSSRPFDVVTKDVMSAIRRTVTPGGAR